MEDKIENSEKLATKEQARSVKEAQRQEKEREKAERNAKKAEKAAKKEQARAEKEALKHQVEAERDKKRRERESKRQQEEAERERKRLEKEAAERKKQAAVQKQASIMDKFLQSKKEHLGKEENVSGQCLNWSLKTSVEVTSTSSMPESVVQDMDKQLATEIPLYSDELLRKHIDAWKRVGPKRYSGQLQKWWLRRIPKVDIFKELKLQGGNGDSSPNLSQGKSSGQASKIGDKYLEEFKTDANWAANQNPEDDLQKCSAGKLLGGRKLSKKLLQFDKSYRPAYYGTFSKRSKIIGPRHPLRKDPSIDYEIESDDEWEEEDPGESLSVCDEDEEDDKLDAEDESGDEFVVPDGYLSEDEGIEVDGGQRDDAATKSYEDFTASSSQDNIERLQRVLNAVTERALKSNCPYIISNFSTDSTVASHSSSKMRDCCLEAIKIHVLAGDVSIEPPKADEEAPKTSVKRSRKSGSLADGVLPEIVQFLQESPQGIKKTVDALSQRFPGVPKSQMETKIREISVYTDNHWKVKEEVLSTFRIQKTKLVADIGETNASTLPSKPISKLFRKRCLPLEENSMNFESLNE